MPEDLDPERAQAEAKRQAAALTRIQRWVDERKAAAEADERAKREREEAERRERQAQQRAELEDQVRRRFLASGGTEAEWRQHGAELVLDELKRRASEGRDAETQARRRQWEIGKNIF